LLTIAVLVNIIYLICLLLADRTAAQYMIGYWHHHVVRLSVRPSVCNAVHYASHGRCTGLKVVPACL